MKTIQLKYVSTLGVILFLIACSTKKDTFLSRNSHALSTEYNILYNGGVALDKGIIDLKSQYKDNFWERLPVERMQVNKDVILPGQAPANPNFERAETKAIMAIQKHSMNIGGSEKNPQIDEAYLMLGKARYYDQRFVPALEAFNYILYKSPNSDKIYEAKIWREKTNIRMDNDALAVKNLRRLLKDIKFKDQIFADANAILSQAFLNLEEKDSAIAKLKLAKEFTKTKEEKARYNFILGQLYEELGYKDSAYASYQTVIDMKRKAARQYVIQAHARQAQQFDYEKGDTLAFINKYNTLLKDRENRPYLDVLDYQMGLFYDKRGKYDQAIKQYNYSLDANSQDQYLIASNYRNLATIYFNKTKYITAGKYYDSTLVKLDARSREFKSIKKKRENLDDVIKYKLIATRNDSIIDAYSLSDSDKISYYENYITELKKQDEAKKLLKEKEAKSMENQSRFEGQDPIQQLDANGRIKDGKEELQSRKNMIKSPQQNNIGALNQSDFYFYNPATIAYGKNEFRKIWGDRILQPNWRINAVKNIKGDNNVETNENNLAEKPNENKIDERYTTDFYIKQLPKSQTEIDSIAKERNFAYYQLGGIYKEKFKEYELAEGKYEKLLEYKPEQRLVLPTMYNLFKIYQITGKKDKESGMKNKIINQFPDSRYAKIIGDTNLNNTVLYDTPETTYNTSYKLFLSGDYKTVLTNLNLAINQFQGEEIVPKLELLKAITIGKLNGLAEFNKALNFVALSYPNSEEGKKAESFLANDLPKLESLKFYEAKPLSWKIIYETGNPEDKSTKTLQDKIKKFITDRSLTKITTSYDIYTMDTNFVVIHGIKTKDYANGVASVLKEFKEYKVTDQAYVISSDNYKIVQIKKNFEDYLKTNPTEPLTQIPSIPTVKTNTNSPSNVPMPAERKPKKESIEEDDPMLNMLMPPQLPEDEKGTPPQEENPNVPKAKK